MVFSTLVASMPFVSRSPGVLSGETMFSLVFILLLVYLWKSLLLPFMFLTRFRSGWALAFPGLTLSWHTRTVSLYTFWVICLSFYLFYTISYFHLGYPCSPMQAPCYLCLISYLLGWTALLDLTSFQGLIPQTTYKETLQHVKVCSPEVIAMHFYLVHFSQVPELHYFAVTVAKAAPDLHITSCFFSLFASNRPSKISLLFVSLTTCINRSFLKTCDFP